MNLVEYFSNLIEPVPLSEMQMAVITAFPLWFWGKVGMCAVHMHFFLTVITSRMFGYKRF